MGDKEIIRLLKKIIEEKLLEGYEFENAKMCLEILNNNNDVNKNNAIDMARNLIRVAGFIQADNKRVVYNVEEDIFTRVKKSLKKLVVI